MTSVAQPVAFGLVEIRNQVPDANVVLKVRQFMQRRAEHFDGVYPPETNRDLVLDRQAVGVVGIGSAGIVIWKYFNTRDFQTECQRHHDMSGFVVGDTCERNQHSVALKPMRCGRHYSAPFNSEVCGALRGFLAGRSRNPERLAGHLPCVMACATPWVFRSARTRKQLASGPCGNPRRLFLVSTS